MKNGKSWYKLDNAGRLYSSTISSRATTLFRVSATLTSTVDQALLQQALQATLERFPFLQVQLKKGFFWYYFEETNEIPEVSEEIYYPCMSLSIRRRGTFPFCVMYYKKRIAVEFSHSLTDGTAALKFLTELIIQYLNLKESLPVKNVTVNEEQLKAETEDGFQKYYEKDIPPLTHSLENAYKLPIKIDDQGVYHITTGIIDVKALKQKAKEYNVSISVFLTAVYIDVLLNIQKSIQQKKPVVINVPVNMRAFFPSLTMRNFFVSITPSVDPRLGEYQFTEVLAEVKHEFNRLLSPKKLKQYIKMNVKREKSLLLRMIPLPIKDLIAPFIYSIFGEKQYTSGLSNLGIANVPNEVQPFIERFECYPPPSIGNKVKTMMISYKDHTYISFGSLSKNRILEREFFRRLRKLGMNIKIETNMEGS